MEECELFIRQAYEVRSHLIAQAKNDYYALPKCDQPFHWVELEHRITLIHSNFIILRDAARLLVRANPSGYRGLAPAFPGGEVRDLHPSAHK